MLNFIFFYVPFYVITRFRAAFLENDADETSDNINWAVMVPFIFEIFVVSWIFLSLFDKADDNENMD